MSEHSSHESPPPVTYSARPPLGPSRLTCKRCKRAYAYPEPNSPPIRCECGWRYVNVDGAIHEEFTPRLGI